jgi:1-deoxy-D-xylulose-5-phosphate synthase
MSIAENHGGLYKNLKELRASNGQCSCNLFKAMGLDYIYQNEGNDIEKMIETFEKVKDIDHPIVVHINTQKGKGYKIAEENKENWHWCMPFDIETGKSKVSFSGEDYGTLTCDYLLKKMKADPKVVAVVAGVPTNIGFTKEKRAEAGKQFVDVGIAEEHAIAFVSGIAKNGGKPIFATHSSFMQRTYDQMSQDLCINNNPATILVNTASVYGMNDVTHLGIYDIPLISNIPNMVYLAPTSKDEYFAMLDWSIEQSKYPVAIRIPCNGVVSDNRAVEKDYSDINKFKVEQKGDKVAIIALGDFYQLGEEISNAISEKLGFIPTLINPRYITGLDKELLETLKENHDVVITLEDGILEGGFGEKIASYYGTSNMKVKNYGIEKYFPDRYVAEELLKENGISVEQILQDVGNMLKI